MDEFELELKNTFLDEAILNLEEVESCFMDLESASDSKPLLDRIFRLAHNLKGGSRSVGFGMVAEFTHELESLVLALQKGDVALNASVISTLLASNDWLVEICKALKSDFNAQIPNEALLSDIKKWLNQPSHEVSYLDTAEAQDIVPLNFAPEEDPGFASEPPAPPPTIKSIIKKQDKEDEVVRVNLSKIELLNDYVGELIVLQSAITQQSAAQEWLRLKTSIQQMVKLSKDIQNLSMGLRMLPVKPLVQKLQRVVRDTSMTLNKKVNFTLIGEGIDIDKSVLDQLVDPLIHIVRNAVDHGLEASEVRQENGKSAEGNINLGFYNEGNQLIVEVKDDGGGINTETLLKKAISKKIVTPSDNLSQKQLINLIFHPGFSTKDITTEVSGRGVGMDVVKSNIESIGGQVEVTTEIKKGSTFRIKIPLSLAVIEGLITLTKRGRYVIPLSQIQETVNLRTVKVFVNKVGHGPCLELRGQIVPIHSLDHLVEPRLKTDLNDPDTIALVFMVNEKLVAFSVKDLMQSQQVVIKPLNNGFRPQKGWVGSCVLGDGLPTLILNPVELLSDKASNHIPKGVAA